MKRTSFAGMDCSIARTLDLVGEWWTPLVLREVFFGHRRFEEIQANLGIARNILTDRLGTLVTAGILERRRYQERPKRYEYRLTDRGLGLFPILLALMRWGDRWLSGDSGPPVRLLHEACGEETEPRYTCSHCGGEITAGSVRSLDRLRV